jgi:hypothetical protein
VQRRTGRMAGWGGKARFAPPRTEEDSFMHYLEEDPP